MHICGFLFVASLLVLSHIGCDRKTAPPPPPAPAVTVAKSDIVGAWVIAKHSYSNAAYNMVKRAAEKRGIDISPGEINEKMGPVIELLNANPSTFNFADNGTFTASSANVTMSGTWSLTGDEVTVNAEDREKPFNFKWWEGTLESFNEAAGGRPVTLVRKQS